MKLSIIISSLALLVSSVVAYFFFTQSTNKVAFVRSVEVLNQYKGMEEAREAYQLKSGIWKAQLDTLQAEFQESLAVYEKEQKGYSDKEKELSEQLLRTRRQQWVDYQKQIEQKAAEEDQKMTSEVLKQINDYLIQYGKENGYTIVFGANQTGNIVYGDDAVDITELVIQKLNGNYSN